MSLIDDGYVVIQKVESMAKVYPRLVRYFKYSDPDYVRRYELDPAYHGKKKKRVSSTDDKESSLRRAKSRVLDIALCNDFDLMVTFTFNKAKVDRYNDEQVRKCMMTWLNHQSHRYGKFRYLMVAERHKDGALHFHGFFGGYKGNITDSGKLENGRKVYNLDSYKLGWTTAVKIDQDTREKAAAYITKYLTKDMPEFKNKRRFWPSKDLKRPLRIINPLPGFLDKYEFNLVLKTNAYEMFEFKGVMADIDIAHMADFGRPRYDDLSVAER